VVIGDDPSMSERVVAFLDVLGFSQQVRNQTHGQLTEIYTALISAAYENTTITSVPEDWRKWDSEPFYHPWEEKKARYVHMMMASDSIVVFSHDATRHGAASVLGSVYRLLRASFRLGMPLRGGMSVGELDILEGDDVAERGSWTAMVGGVVGTGLVDAHDLERGFQWSGVAISAAVQRLLCTEFRELLGDAFADFDAAQATPFVADYHAPLKDRDKTISRWVVDWPTEIDDRLSPLTRELVEASFVSHGRALTDESAQAKRDNTLAFWDARVYARR
jgi:hypothetical protein